MILPETLDTVRSLEGLFTRSPIAEILAICVDCVECGALIPIALGVEDESGPYCDVGCMQDAARDRES